GNRDHSWGWSDNPAGGFQVGQRQAGDRLIAESVELLGRQFQLAADVRRLAQDIQGLEPLPHAPAYALRLRLRGERLEQPLAAPGLGLLSLALLELERLDLGAIDPGRDGRTDGEERRQDGGRDVRGRQPGVALAPAPELL